MTEQLSLLDGDDEPGPSDPLDQPARDRIRADVDRNLFVEAGAGSGKTSELVERIFSLVLSGVEVQHIAAITFTEKAAAELRQRVRERLEEARRADPADSRWREALHQLDSAAISTLHSFAQRILFEHPVEAGLPPGVEVLDELASQVHFDERWEAHVPVLLAREDMGGPLLVGDVLGIRIPELKSLAQQFEDNWDLLRRRLPDHVEPLSLDVTAVVEELRAVGAAASEALDPEDHMAQLLESVGAYANEVEDAARAAADPVDRLVDLAEVLTRPKPSFGTKGEPYKQKGNRQKWADGRLEELKIELWEAGQARDRCRARLGQAVIEHLASAVGAFVLASVDERRREGRLRFHDLLVLARDVLRDPDTGAAVRSSLRDRYRRLLIDEFQDTDPIQVDLAALITADAADHEAVNEDDWERIPTEAGRLFFVGDPKQSIYRFRRADIGTYLRAQERFGEGSPVSLTTNFRSSATVIDWVNRVFSQVIVAAENSQPGYTPLRGMRPAPSVGPGVMAVGAQPHQTDLKANELRVEEATDVAATVVRAVTDGWTVTDPVEDRQRPARLGDITILLPARTSLPWLEQALENAGVPYRAETASLVFATPEVRDLLMIARAVDDPTDELAVVAALRSPALGCGDDDLYRYRAELGGRWDHQRVDDLPGRDPVVAGMAWMGALHRERPWLAPAQILDRIIEERQLLELGACRHRHREVWRRLRFVVDQARAWTDATGGDLRQYLTWVHLQASESARVAETVLPETDTDAVRIMTVHASKGLEFPITIVSGLTTQRRVQQARVHVVWPPEGGIGYRLGADNTTPLYEDFQPIDEQLDDHERLRLLYVACTRARDHLVVSMHRVDSKPSGSLAEVLAEHGGGVGVATPTGPEPRQLEIPTEPVGRPALPPRSAWEQERAQALDRARRSRTVAATTVARVAAQRHDDPGLRKAGRDLDLPPWQKGRYGTAVGRAVHGVLQSIDLATGEGLAGAVAAQAAAEGVLGREADIEGLCRSALASELVREAARRPHWREIYVATPVESRLLEGYVDLLYEGDQGLVLVDHKTDAWHDQEDLDDKVARYRIQLGAYALAVEAATERPVSRAVLLFLDPDGAVTRSVPDLDGAKDQVRAVLQSVVEGGQEEVGA